MFCKNPYIRTPHGVKKKDVILSEDARLHSTPFGCGQCLPCRINKSRNWTARIILEAKKHESTCFTTLTYDEGSVPDGYSLSKRDFQLFIKRFRYFIDPHKVRYFGVGEYGDDTFRPHYHIILFGIDSVDPNVKKAWQKGFTQSLPLSPYLARYITGYVVKKMTKSDDDRLKGRDPEFMTCSRNGGIGSTYIDMLAEHIKKQPYYNGNYIDEIKIGKKLYHLGRYLSERLNQKLDSNINEKELKFYEHQNEMFDKILNGGHTGVNFQEAYGQEIHNLEKRHKIYSRRRKL